MLLEDWVCGHMYGLHLLWLEGNSCHHHNRILSWSEPLAGHWSLCGQRNVLQLTVEHCAEIKLSVVNLWTAETLPPTPGTDQEVESVVLELRVFEQLLSRSL